MRKLVLALACTMLAGPVMAQSVSEKTGVNSVLSVAPSTQDFVTEVAISDQFEIQSSQLAVEKGDAPTKGFAQQMITDHKKTSSELSAMVTAGTVKATVPTQLDSSHQDKLDKLKSLSGTDFTKQYQDDQVSAHKSAVSLFQRYAKGGDNAALKDWAGKTEPALSHHLDLAQNLKK